MVLEAGNSPAIIFKHHRELATEEDPPQSSTKPGFSPRPKSATTSAFASVSFTPANAKNEVDTRTPAELIDLIEAKSREVQELLAALKAL